MKQQMKYIMSLVVLLVCSTTTWADGTVTITKQKNGTVTTDGEVAYDIAGGKCTLTLTRPSGYSETAADITAVKVLDTENMEAPAFRAPEIVSKLTVTAVGGQYQFDWPGSPYDVDVTVDFQPNTNTSYTVAHYQENVNGGYPGTATETEQLTGTTDEQTEAAAKTYDGFTAGTVTQTTIAGDGSTVVTIQYSRNSYSITFNSDGGSAVTTITAKHGAAITAPANPTKDGYDFGGWYDGASVYAFTTMPIGGKSLTAHWTAQTYSDPTSGATAETNGDGTVQITDVPATAVGTDGGLTLPATVGEKQVTEIASDAFDNVNMANVEYVDLSETGITELTVNRESGLFEDLDKNALVYLPAGNTAGENVVVGGTCSDYKIYDDGKDYEVKKAFTASQASFTRTYTNNVMSTVYLPFAVPTAEAGGTFYEYDGLEGNTVKTKAVTGTATEANKPYIFVPSSTGSISLTSGTGITVAATMNNQTNGRLVGTYEPIAWTTDQSTIYGFAAETRGAITAGTFVQVKAGASINPFRDYLELTSGAPAMLEVVIDGSATAVSGLKRDASAAAQWYTIDGRRLTGKPGQKGLYIHNGRKVVIE